MRINPLAMTDSLPTRTAQDSRILRKFGGSLAQDSRICDEKVGLCSGEQGDKTRVSIDAASHKLPTLSRKAESTSHITHLLDSRAYPPHTPPPFPFSTLYLSF